jgi:hypothetical protein
MAVKSALQEVAERHLWMNFSQLGSYARGQRLPVMVRAPCSA